MRVKLLMVLGLMILLIDCNGVFAQRGGGKGGRGGPGGGGPGGGGPGGGGGFDPAQMFDRMAGGKEVWVRADITDQRQLGMFDRIAQGIGVTNGQITREQFTTGMQQMRANGGGRGPGGGGPGGQQGPGGGPGGAPQGETFDQMAERQFKQMDRNGDGFLNSDEVSGSLRTEFTRWDANRDGLLDLAEFKNYLQDQMRQNQNGPAQFDLGNIAPEPEEDKRPVVYTAGNYPKELPPWFKQLDLDKDGQIGLYEWRRAGKAIDEFESMDRNNDGFLTVEEVLYAQALAKKTGTTGTQFANLGPGNGPAGNEGQPGFGGGRPQFGNGRPQLAGMQPGGGGPQMGGQQRFGNGRPQMGGGQPGDNGSGGGFRKKGGNRGGGQGGG